MRIHKLSATIKVEKNIILHLIHPKPNYLAQNTVLRKIFWPKKDKVTGTGEECIMMSFMTCTVHRTLFEWLQQEQGDERGMLHVWGQHKNIQCWWGNLTERAHLEGLCVDNRVISKRVFKKYD